MSTREAVIDSMAGTTVTCFKGRRPKATDIDTLERELAEIASEIKTSLYTGGEEHGHLCCVISDEAYAEIIDEDFQFAPAVQPEAYDPTITAEMGDVQRKQMEAEWEKSKVDYQKYLGVQHVLRNLIVSAVDSQHLRKLYNEYTKYTRHTARKMIDHLRGKVKLTETEKTKMQDQINMEWDQSEDFPFYIQQLEMTRRRLARWGINIDEPTLISAANRQISKCTTFTREHMKRWDDLEDEEKDWDVFKEHFMEVWDEEEQYAEDTAGKGGLQGINAVEETTNEEMDEQMAEYLYELKVAATSNTETIQQVNEKTLNVVKELTTKVATLTNTVAQQQKTITSQQQTIAQLVAQGGKVPDDKKEAPAQAEQKYCKNCQRMVLHKEKNCLELPANASRRRQGWKSVFEGKKNPHTDN